MQAFTLTKLFKNFISREPTGKFPSGFELSQPWELSCLEICFCSSSLFLISEILNMTLWVVFIWPLQTSYCLSNWHLKHNRWITPCRWLFVFTDRKRTCSIRQQKSEEIHSVSTGCSFCCRHQKTVWSELSIQPLPLLPGQSDIPCFGSVEFTAGF